MVADFVEGCNMLHLHSAGGYISPNGELEGRAKRIFAERDANPASGGTGIAGCVVMDIRSVESLAGRGHLAGNSPALLNKISRASSHA